MGETRTKCKLSLQTSCACVMVAEALAVSNSLVVCIVNLCRGEQDYSNNVQVIPNIVKYRYLLPISIIEVLWLCTNVIALIAIKCVVPYLMLPYFIFSIISLIIGAIFFGFTIDVLIHLGEWSWTGSIFLACISLFVLLELYFTSLKLRCFRGLVKRKKAVQGTSDEKPAVADIDRFTSFSRRSTVIISDDFFEAPPKM